MTTGLSGMWNRIPLEHAAKHELCLPVRFRGLRHDQEAVEPGAHTWRHQRGCLELCLPDDEGLGNLLGPPEAESWRRSATP